MSSTTQHHTAGRRWYMGLAMIAVASMLAGTAHGATLTGDAFVGVVGNGAGDTNTGLVNNGNGVIASLDDGIVTTSKDTIGPDDDSDYAGVRFTTDQKVGTIIVTTNDFVDGGWWNSSPTAPKLQTTTANSFHTESLGESDFVSNVDGIWADQTAASNYPGGFNDSNGVDFNTAADTELRTHFWSPSAPIEGVSGVRVIGDPGGVAGTFDTDGFIAVSEVQAFEGVVQADLATDYVAGSSGQTSSAVGISGFRSGTWNYHSDSDSDPTNGGLALLTFGSAGLEGGSGYTGTGTIFNNCCGSMPAIAGVGLFDGVTTLPGADVLAVHPGGSGGIHVGPEYLVIQYTTTGQLIDVSISYDFDQPAAGDGVDWRFVADDGTVLASGIVSSGRVVGAFDIAGGLAAGESVFLVIGNGAGDSPGADQTFARFTVIANAPAPAALPVGLAMLGLIAARRPRR